MAMSNPNKFKKLATVPVHYDRFPPSTGFGYGTRGKALTFRCDTKLKKTLNKLYKDLFAISPARYGQPEVITSAGTYVDRSGYHGRGLAFDFDGLFWNRRTFIANEFPDDKLLYLAIEAVCRKHFGTILNYEYNRAHEDHLHLDTGTKVGFNTMSKSRVTFLQNTLESVYGEILGRFGVDGVYGPNTSEAQKRVRRSLGIGTLTNKNNWLVYLDATARKAFVLAP